MAFIAFDPYPFFARFHLPVRNKNITQTDPFISKEVELATFRFDYKDYGKLAI